MRLRLRAVFLHCSVNVLQHIYANSASSRGFDQLSTIILASSQLIGREGRAQASDLLSHHFLENRGT